MNGSCFQPPEVARLAETARISLNPHEVVEFAPKIRQSIDWKAIINGVPCYEEPYLRVLDKEEEIQQIRARGLP